MFTQTLYSINLKWWAKLKLLQRIFVVEEHLNFILIKIRYQTFFQVCHTLREFRETQKIFKLKKISGKLRETQGISGNFDLFLNPGKLREVLIFSKKFREVLRFKNP